MSNAKLLVGNFSGADSGSVPNFGVNVPTGSLYGVEFGNVLFYDVLIDSYGLVLSENMIRARNIDGVRIFKPIHASAIDDKMDDGTPDSGRIIGAEGGSGTDRFCTTGSLPNVTYHFTYDTPECYLQASVP